MLGTAPTSADKGVELGALYAAGEACAKGKNWSCAAEKFRVIFEKTHRKPPPEVLVALGIAERELGHLLSARKFFKQAIEETEYPRATQEMRALMPLIPRLKLLAPREVELVRVTQGGTELEQDRELFLLDPEQQNLILHFRNKKPLKATVVAQRSAIVELKITREQLEETETLELPTTKASSSGRIPPPLVLSSGPPTGALVLGGLGLVMASVGGYVFLKGRSDFIEAARPCNAEGWVPSVDEHCTADDAQKAKIQADTKAPGDRALAGSIVFYTGLGAVAVGALWWGLSGNQSRQTARLGVVPSRQGAQAWATFSF